MYEPQNIFAARQVCKKSTNKVRRTILSRYGRSGVDEESFFPKETNSMVRNKCILLIYTPYCEIACFVLVCFSPNLLSSPSNLLELLLLTTKSSLHN